MWKCKCSATTVQRKGGQAVATGKGWLKGQAGTGTFIVCRECSDQIRIGLEVKWAD